MKVELNVPLNTLDPKAVGRRAVKAAQALRRRGFTATVVPVAIRESMGSYVMFVDAVYDTMHQGGYTGVYSAARALCHDLGSLPISLAHGDVPARFRAHDFTLGIDGQLDEHFVRPSTFYDEGNVLP